jgi:uncharacterized protein involved in exopolysaccharide biosynthesis|nr:Wzz/FepE/Etk N-terminal domain-containing protein [Candidatus Krumholzibacteria bacterium]
MDPFLDEPQSEEGGFDPRALIRMFLRRKWLFIIPFILCFSMAILVIKIMTPIYFSAGQVQIVMRDTETRLLNDASQQYGRYEREIDQKARQEIDLLLTSPDFLENVVRDLQLHVDPTWVGPPPPGQNMSESMALGRATKKLKDRLRLEPDGSRLFLIGIRDTNPQRAHNLAVYVVDKFVEEFRANQVAFRTSTRDFLQGQLEEYRSELEDAENELSTFLANMASETLVNLSINAGNLSVAEENLALLSSRYNGQDLTEVSRLEQQTKPLVGASFNLNRYVTDASVSAIAKEMGDLAFDQLMMSPDAIGFRDMQTRLGLLRVRLNSKIEQLTAADFPHLSFMDRNQVSQYIYLSVFRNSSRSVIDKMNRQIAEFRSFATRQPAQSARLSELQSDVERSRNLVQTIEGEVTQQTMNLEASMSEIGFQVKIRKKVAFPLYPIEPNKLKLLMMGFVLSVGLGGGLVVLAIFMDRTFTAVDDIEKALGLTVIGTLPVIVDDHFERTKKRRILRWVTIIVGIIAVSAVGFLVIYPRLS